jgi:hypothetical protein
VQKNPISKGIYYYIPPKYEDSVEVQVTYRALSFKELNSLTDFLQSGRHNLFNYQVCKTAILEIEDVNGDTLQLADLTPEIIKDTSMLILEVSSLSEDDYNKLQLTIDIAFDNTFKGDSWKCEVCQYKKLDRIRNCGIRGEHETKPNKDFSVMVGKQLYRHCPIYEVEPYLLDAAIESYNMYDKNLLPDEGGLYDQTKFFIIASRLVKQKLDEEQAKELKKLKNKG